jgi:hypothetical protein
MADLGQMVMAAPMSGVPIQQAVKDLGVHLASAGVTSAIIGSQLDRTGRIAESSALGACCVVHQRRPPGRTQSSGVVAFWWRNGSREPAATAEVTGHHLPFISSTIGSCANDDGGIGPGPSRSGLLDRRRLHTTCPEINEASRAGRTTQRWQHRRNAGPLTGMS